MTDPRTPALKAAYGYCRAVARREAKNFYWAFRVLPQHKSDAMCAVYAFMRKADDLADDETLSIDARRTAMAKWTDAWRVSRTQAGADPVFVALNDTQQRFGISDELLEQLVAGTTMDLQPQPEGVVLVRETTRAAQETHTEEYQAYENFDALYRYCYLVASVVGLVCIRIFGYTDPRAELLAEHTGIAFQLTNILRDVREDAERGRIYLPLEDLEACGVAVEDLIVATKGVLISVGTKAVMLKEIARAHDFYRSSDQLIPLLESDAQPAMLVLATIYRRLLERIAQNPDAVFRSRVSVPTTEKLAILARGLIASLSSRRIA